MHVGPVRHHGMARQAKLTNNSTMIKASGTGMHQRFHGQTHAMGQGDGPLGQQPQQLLSGDKDHLFGQHRQN